MMTTTEATGLVSVLVLYVGVIALELRTLCNVRAGISRANGVRLPDRRAATAVILLIVIIQTIALLPTVGLSLFYDYEAALWDFTSRAPSPATRQSHHWTDPPFVPLTRSCYYGPS